MSLTLEQKRLNWQKEWLNLKLKSILNQLDKEELQARLYELEIKLEPNSRKRNSNSFKKI